VKGAQISPAAMKRTAASIDRVKIVLGTKPASPAARACSAKTCGAAPDRMATGTPGAA
jgi:hypothetical protein